MSGTLSPTVERWLGIDPAGPGEGTLWKLEFAWRWAPWLTLLAAVVVIAWVVYFYARETSPASRLTKAVLVSLRLALVALVGLMIAQAMLSLRRTGLPTVVVMVDDSASMGIADHYSDEKLRALLTKRAAATGLRELTRLNVAKSLLFEPGRDLASRMASKYKLKFYLVSDAARALEIARGQERATLSKLEPLGSSSRLGVGLRQVLSDLRGTPPAAIIVLSDGITTAGEPLSDAARQARRKGVPLFAVGVGSDEPVRDVELRDLLVDDVVFLDDVVNFDLTLVSHGLAGRSVEVVLRQQNAPQVLARQKVTLGPEGQIQKVRLSYRPTQVGDFQYVVEAQPLADEAQTDNNRQFRPLSVRKERLKVLLVQSYPNYEFRYLKNMLERDSTIELKAVLQDADPEFSETDKSALRMFPVRREELYQFDVVILGDVNPGLLSTPVLANLRQFVEEKGGGLAVIAGELYMPLAYRATPLAPLLPFDVAALGPTAAASASVEPYAVQPTDLGLSSPQMQLADTLAETAQVWQNLPPLYWLLELPALKPAARVLAEHPTRTDSAGRKLPIFILQYVGAGKVLFHATDETWRWRFRQGDALFARYWVQAIRYLSRSKLLGKDRSVELSAERRQYPRGEPIRLRARFLDERVAPADDAGVTVVLERPGHPNQSVSLHRTAVSRGIFEATLTDLPDGPVHAWVASPTLEGQAPATDFVVVAPAGELERMQLDVGELRTAAQQTHGRYYSAAEADRLLGDLPPGNPVPTEQLPPQILWNRWWLLSTFLVLLVGEWILRKRTGML